MARIRSVHPGLYTDEAFMGLTVDAPLACVLLIGLWNEADDQGVFEWKPLTLKARILPAATVDVGELLTRLVADRFVQRFEVEGKAYGAIRNFRKFQRPEKPKATHPLPPDLWSFVRLPAAVSEPSPPRAAGDITAFPASATTKEPVPSQSVDGHGALIADPVNGRAPVADQSSNGCGKSAQMEDGGGKEGGKVSSLRSDTPSRAAKQRAFEAVFEQQFWPRYPRKVDKGDARKAFVKACSKAEPDAIIRGLVQQTFNPDPQYIPHAATWLNGERWLDEPPKPNGADRSRSPPSFPGIF